MEKFLKMLSRKYKYSITHSMKEVRKFAHQNIDIDETKAIYLYTICPIIKFDNFEAIH